MFTTLFLLIDFPFSRFTEISIFRRIRFFDDESDDDGSGSGPPGRCNFPFCSINTVGRVSGVGSDIFVTPGIESIGDVAPLFVFVPR